jgi:hypothetical protein
LTVSPGSQLPTRDLTGITIIPGTQTLNTLGETAQFIVIGTFSSSPTTQSMAGLVTWQSSDANVATVNSSGSDGCGLRHHELRHDHNGHGHRSERRHHHRNRNFER